MTLVDNDLGSQLLRASPPPMTSNIQPYTIEEIDDHEDSNRIWATLLAIRQASAYHYLQKWKGFS